MALFEPSPETVSDEIKLTDTPTQGFAPFSFFRKTGQKLIFTFDNLISFCQNTIFAARRLPHITIVFILITVIFANMVETAKADAFANQLI